MSSPISDDERRKKMEAIMSRASNRRQPELQQLIAFHLRDAINKDPVEKIRLTIEAYYMAAGTEEGQKLMSVSEQTSLDRMYLVCLSLRGVHATDPFISIPWAFPPSLEGYKAYIDPWHMGVAASISFRYTNDAKRLDKEKRLVGHPNWEAFFIKTMELDLSPTSLLQLKTAFAAYSMRKLMMLYSKLGIIYTRAIQWDNAPSSGSGEGEGKAGEAD